MCLFEYLAHSPDDFVAPTSAALQLCAANNPDLVRVSARSRRAPATFRNGGASGSLEGDSTQPQEIVMPDADRIKGSANQAKGAVKEVAGKALGDSKLETEGKADKVKGKLQNAVGGLKDAVKGE